MDPATTRTEAGRWDSSDARPYRPSDQSASPTTLQHRLQHPISDTVKKGMRRRHGICASHRNPDIAVAARSAG